MGTLKLMDSIMGSSRRRLAGSREYWRFQFRIIRMWVWWRRGRSTTWAVNRRLWILPGRNRMQVITPQYTTKASEKVHSQACIKISLLLPNQTINSIREWARRFVAIPISMHSALKSKWKFFWRNRNQSQLFLKKQRSSWNEIKRGSSKFMNTSSLKKQRSVT